MANKSTRACQRIFWEVNGLTQEIVQKYKPKDYFNSPKFSLNLKNFKTEWTLFLYPAGCDSEFPEHISIVVELDTSSSLKFQVFLDFGIISSRNGKSHLSFFAKAIPAWEIKPRGYGKYNFLSHKKLFDSENGFFVGGKLTLFCNIVLAKPESCITPNPWGKEMFEDESFTDLQIQASDKKFVAAHKLVIKTRSPEFFKLLMGENEKADKVDLLVVDSELLETLLCFIYTNELDLEVLDDRRVILNLLKLVDKLTGAEALMERCLDLIAMNFKIISSWEEWVNVPQTVVTKATELLASNTKAPITIATHVY